MTSLGSSSVLGLDRVTKPRSKALVVKPILKKLSQSEKNSLDLDRGWEDQIHYGSHGWGGGEGGGRFRGLSDTGLGRAGHGVYESSGGGGGGGSSRPARDVSFSLSATDLNLGSGSGVGLGGGGKRFTHTRSTSGTSHISIATTGSGHGTRNGSFVHPFQQTPRTSTPPLSYANSLTSFDTSNVRDYSPTITEDDDDLEPPFHRGYHPPAGNHPHSHTPYPSSNLRRPSLASQRTNSLSDIQSPPPLRINTSGRSNSGPSARVPQGVLCSSRSDLQLYNSYSAVDSPASGSVTPAAGSQPLTSPALASPSSSLQPLSPIRNSLEMGFRMRSRSEVDTAAHREQVREARKKFEEKQRVKEEKYARAAVEKRDRAATKEAVKFEKTQAQLMKGPGAMTGTSSGRNSSSAEARPSASRKSTRDGYSSEAEKMGFASSLYNSTAPATSPRADDVSPDASRRMHTAKKKTQSAWTAFMLWVRHRLLKLGRR